jgi:hypothetical protein
VFHAKVNPVLLSSSQKVFQVKINNNGALQVVLFVPRQQRHSISGAYLYDLAR